GGPAVSPSGENTLVAASASAAVALGGLVAVATDPPIGPPCGGRVVLIAARARIRPGGWVAWLPGTRHQSSDSSGTTRTRRATGLPGLMPRSSGRLGALAVAAARIST